MSLFLRPLVLAEGRTSALAIPTQRRFGSYRRFKLARFEADRICFSWRSRDFMVSLIPYSRIALRLGTIFFRKTYSASSTSGALCHQMARAEFKGLAPFVFHARMTADHSAAISFSDTCGKYTTNVAPCPGALSTSIVPPLRLMMS